MPPSTPVFRELGTPIKAANWVRLHPGRTADGQPSLLITMGQNNGGPFLLKPGAAPGKWVILGRYGPDTYPVDLIRDRLGKHGKR